MRKFVVAAAIAGMFAFGATASMAETPQTATVNADAETEISPAKQALLERLDRAMDFDGMMKSMFAGMMPAMSQALRESNPDITEQQSKDWSDVTTKVMAKYIPRMKTEMFQTYARVFSEDELAGMAAFYESPTGQSVLKKMPLIMQDYMPAMSRMMPEMLEDIRVGLCEKGMCMDKPAK